MENYQKKIFYNMSSGLITRLAIMLLGLIFPKLFIETFGSEVNGLVSSITQIYTYLGLLEAGVGVASLQTLYSPIAKKDQLKVNGILSASKKFYNKASIYYLIGIVAISILYPLTIDSSLSRNIILIITFSSGIAGLIRFQNNAVRLNILKAEGKEYVVNYFTSFSSVLIYFVKIVLLNYGMTIVIIQFVDVVITLVQSVILHLYFRLNYKWVNFNVKPKFESLSQSKSVMVHQISELVFNSTDILILTYFTNFTIVSVYVLYNTIANAVNMINNQVSEAFTFIIGQSIVGDLETLKKKFDLYEFFYLSFSFALATIMYLLFIPFLSLYTENFANSEIYLDNALGLLFSLRLILLVGRRPFQQLIDTAGHFRNTRKQSVIESILNLVCSLILVNFLGIYGVLIGTMIALIYRTSDMIIYSNRKILKRTSAYNLIKFGLHLTLFCLIVLVNQSFLGDIIDVDNNIFKFITSAIIVITISFSLYICLNLMFYIKQSTMVFNFLKLRMNRKK